MPPSLIAPAAARDRLRRGDPDFVLLDIREPEEIALARIEGSVWIPMREIARRAAELDPAKEIAVICHHGTRSAHVAKILGRLGFARVLDVAGGIDRWSVEADPAVPRYG